MSDFRTATEEETDDQCLRLSDVGLSDTEPVYSTPTFWDSIRRLPKRLMPWNNQNMWGGNLANHIWFYSAFLYEEIEKRLSIGRKQ